MKPEDIKKGDPMKYYLAEDGSAKVYDHMHEGTLEEAIEIYEQKWGCIYAGTGSQVYINGIENDMGKTCYFFHNKKSDRKILTITAETPIAKKLAEYLSVPDRRISTAGSSFTTDEFWAFKAILDGTDNDFVIFDNRGGRAFMCWMDGQVIPHAPKSTFKAKPMIKQLQEENKMGMVYMYQLDGVQTIVSELPDF